MQVWRAGRRFGRQVDHSCANLYYVSHWIRVRLLHSVSEFTSPVLNLVRVAMWQETGGKSHQDLHKRYSPLKQRANRLLAEQLPRWTNSRRSWDMSKEDVVHE